MEDFRETMPDVYARWQDRGDMTFQFPGGEQRAAFFERAACALEDVIENAGEGPVVVVAHGGMLRAGLAYLFPETMRDWWGYALENASLTQVQVGPQGNVLVALNDRLHLDGRRPHE
jgi:broad specificity phosphatase PhoE